MPTFDSISTHERLTCACKQGNTQIIEEILSSIKSSKKKARLVNKIDGYGYIPLAWSVARGDLASIDILIDHGSNPNFIISLKSTSVRKSLLEIAVRTEDIAVFKKLLDRGADPNFSSSRSSCILECIDAHECDDNIKTELGKAAIDAGFDFKEHDYIIDIIANQKHEPFLSRMYAYHESRILKSPLHDRTIRSREDTPGL